MTWTREEQIGIANTIIQQLGGNQFRAMTGAKNFMALDSGLSFALPNARKANGVKFVRVILDPNDTYTVQFFRGNQTPRDLSHEIAGEGFYNTYCDQLRGLFEDVTGLCTSLTNRYAPLDDFTSKPQEV